MEMEAILEIGYIDDHLDSLEIIALRGKPAKGIVLEKSKFLT